MKEFAFIVPPKSREEIRIRAIALRSIAKCMSGRFDIVGFLEFDILEYDPNFKLEVCTNEEMGDLLGLTFPKQSTIKLRIDIYDGARDGDGFCRMTVAHELGHYVNHSEDQIGFARQLVSRGTAKYMNSEWQANCFAGELLVPCTDRSIVVTMTPEQIASTYGVSLAAAKNQKRNLLREEHPSLW